MGQVQQVKFKRVEQPSQAAVALGGVAVQGRSGWVASVSFEDGSRMVADRVDGECGWHVAGRFTSSGVPVFFNGELSRCTIPEMVDDEFSVFLLEELFWHEETS